MDLVAILPELAGVVGVAGLVSILVKAHIDKKAELRLSRRKAIDRWRSSTGSSFDASEFVNTSTYSEMKPHLSIDLQREIDPQSFDPEGGRGKIFVRARFSGTRDSLQQRLLDEVTRIESDVWKLR